MAVKVPRTNAVNTNPRVDKKAAGTNVQAKKAVQSSPKGQEEKIEHGANSGVSAASNTNGLPMDFLLSGLKIKILSPNRFSIKGSSASKPDKTSGLKPLKGGIDLIESMKWYIKGF